jgi:hypothetical protein
VTLVLVRLLMDPPNHPYRFFPVHCHKSHDEAKKKVVVDRARERESIAPFSDVSVAAARVCVCRCARFVSVS